MLPVVTITKTRYLAIPARPYDRPSQLEEQSAAVVGNLRLINDSDVDLDQVENQLDRIIEKLARMKEA
jgi:hypothetical protein